MAHITFNANGIHGAGTAENISTGSAIIISNLSTTAMRITLTVTGGLILNSTLDHGEAQSSHFITPAAAAGDDVVVHVGAGATMAIQDSGSTAGTINIASGGAVPAHTAVGAAGGRVAYNTL